MKYIRTLTIIILIILASIIIVGNGFAIFTFILGLLIPAAALFVKLLIGEISLFDHSSDNVFSANDVETLKSIIDKHSDAINGLSNQRKELEQLFKEIIQRFKE